MAAPIRNIINPINQRLSNQASNNLLQKVPITFFQTWNGGNLYLASYQGNNGAPDKARFDVYHEDAPAGADNKICFYGVINPLSARWAKLK